MSLSIKDIEFHPGKNIYHVRVEGHGQEDKVLRVEYDTYSQSFTKPLPPPLKKFLMEYQAQMRVSCGVW